MAIFTEAQRRVLHGASGKFTSTEKPGEVKGAISVFKVWSEAAESVLREMSGSINKYDVRRAEEEWEEAHWLAKSYEEDGDKRAPEARKKADDLKAALEALKAKWEKQRAKSREYSRARSGAMSSLGMKRSRYGGWE